MVKFLTYIGLLTAVILGGHRLLAQDLHFSHFNKNPLYVNPALSGKFNGRYKVMAISRNQWSTVTTPYRSFGAVLESSSIGGKSPIGSAISLYRDVAGDSRFTTTKADVGVSYTLPVNYNRSAVVTFGIQAGLHHYGLDYSKLQFDNQYVEESGFNPSLPTNESFATDNILAPSGSAGISFIKEQPNYVVVVGAGAYNLFQSDLALYRQGLSTATQNIRMNYYGSLEYLYNDFVLIPSVLFTQSSVLNETILSLQARYQKDPYFPEITVGGMYRLGDAIIGTIGLAMSPWEVGFSYDFNTSTLARASRGYGAVEVFISYIIGAPEKANSKKNRFQVCPSFI